MDIEFHPQGLPETILPEPPADAAAALAAAAALPAEQRKKAIGEVVATWPRFMAAWAALGDVAEDPVESYAYYRVGYHRGLDALRAAGWRGKGFVRRSHESNHGFLDALAGLGRRAADIGEHDEVSRIGEFLSQLDPDWGQASTTS